MPTSFLGDSDIPQHSEDNPKFRIHCRNYTIKVIGINSLLRLANADLSNRALRNDNNKFKSIFHRHKNIWPENTCFPCFALKSWFRYDGDNWFHPADWTFIDISPVHPLPPGFTLNSVQIRSALLHFFIGHMNRHAYFATEMMVVARSSEQPGNPPILRHVDIEDGNPPRDIRYVTIGDRRLFTYDGIINTIRAIGVLATHEDD